MIVEPCIYTEPEGLPGTVEFAGTPDGGHSSPIMTAEDSLKNPFTGSPVIDLRNPFTGSPPTQKSDNMIPQGANGRLPPLQADRNVNEISLEDELGLGLSPDLGWTNRSLGIVDTQMPSSEIDSKIEGLMNMLECPVCLDTADRPPIYQCPEGHLLCESCNHRLVTCPQCGHKLLNSRNRTAEDLCVKLQLLQGNRGRTGGPDQSILTSVSEPRKIKKGLFSPIVYKVSSKIRQDTRNSAYSVTREYKDFLAVYAFLESTYSKEGVIVPPPPAQASLKTVATVASLSPDQDLSASSASQVIGSRCVALDRYLKRLVRHPVIKKDPVFRSFIQEKEMPKSIKVKSTWSDKAKSMLASFRSRMSVKEKDPWFATRKNQLLEMLGQLEQMQITLANMSMLKQRLHNSSDQFRRDLVLMLVSRNQSRDNNLGNVINDVVDCHRTMSGIFEQQALADRLITELAVDYSLVVDSAMSVLAQRRNLQMELEKAQKKSSQNYKTKTDQVSSMGGGQDDSDGEKELELLTNRFENVSRTLRRELEHFDVVMKEEFESAFSVYKISYWRSLQSNSKPFALSPDIQHDNNVQDLELYPSLPPF